MPKRNLPQLESSKRQRETLCYNIGQVKLLVEQAIEQLRREMIADYYRALLAEKQAQFLGYQEYCQIALPNAVTDRPSYLS